MNEQPYFLVEIRGSDDESKTPTFRLVQADDTDDAQTIARMWAERTGYTFVVATAFKTLTW